MAKKQNLLQFRPPAIVIRTIGDRLISGPAAAVIELVRNSYDADAKEVFIKFTPPLEAGKGFLEISDDGLGMSFQIIHDVWMEPATSEKIHEDISPGGRRRLGSKISETMVQDWPMPWPPRKMAAILLPGRTALLREDLLASYFDWTDMVTSCGSVVTENFLVCPIWFLPGTGDFSSWAIKAARALE